MWHISLQRRYAMYIKLCAVLKWILWWREKIIVDNSFTMSRLTLHIWKKKWEWIMIYSKTFIVQQPCSMKKYVMISMHIKLNLIFHVGLICKLV